MPIPLGVSARLTNGQNPSAASDSIPQQGSWGQQPSWSQDSWSHQAVYPQQSWGQPWGADSQQSWGSGSQLQQPQTQPQQQQWPDASQQQQPWGGGAQQWGAESWGQTLAAQSHPSHGMEGQVQAVAIPGVEAQEQALALQSQEVPAQESAPDMFSQMPDLSALQQQQPGQPASWTNAIFDQTARELWARLQEEGLSPEECAEQFQNHMLAVYTQMQTQQQYEAIAESNATVTAQLDTLQPKDPMEKLKPLFKGDEKEPHRTALGMDPLMKYYERSRNAPFGIFIGGLRTVTNEDVLVRYFSQFGEITFVEVKRLPDRTSRGFAFLHFENDDGVLKVLARKDSHLIDGKQVDCKRMEPMDSAKPSKKERAKQAADAVSAHVSQFQSSGYGWRSQPY